MNLKAFTSKYGDTHGVNLYYIFGTIILLTSVFVYGYIRCLFGSNDFFSHHINQYIDGWKIVHFTIFLVVGFLFPGTFLLSMTIGIFWEIFEAWAGYAKPSFLNGIGNCRHDITFWWYGQYLDVLADLFGFLLGKFVFIPLLL